jgi:Zn-dependent protease
VFGSIRIGTIRGIPIHLHITLLAMVALLVVKYQAIGLPAGFILFGSVLLHELGHSLVAQRYGIRIASIVLHLLGGMALMTRPPERPRHEIFIAAAGPAVSFTLGLALWGIGTIFGSDFSALFTGRLEASTLISFGAYVNLLMGVFNLLPALPMDGGRIFRAALAERLGTLSATRIAAWVSRAFGAVFIAFGLYTGQYSLLIVAAMLFLMVWNEQRVAEAQEAAKQRATERETREEFIDAFGRRYVVITRVIE